MKVCTRKSTRHKPDQPLMAWDGKCGFCHYWVIKWKFITGDRVVYKPFQDVHKDFPDIDLKEMRKAIHFIDTDGRVYAGAAAVFHAMHKYGRKWRWIMPLYNRFWPFRVTSDLFYSFVSRNRNWIYRITVRLFGKNPARPKAYWAAYLGGFLGVLILVFVLSG